MISNSLLVDFDYILEHLRPTPVHLAPALQLAIVHHEVPDVVDSRSRALVFHLPCEIHRAVVGLAEQRFDF